MPFANGSNLFLTMIEVSVALSSVTTFSLVFILIYVRSRNAITRKRQHHLTTTWRNIFKTPYTGEPEPLPLPTIRADDWFTVLRLFIQFHEIREKDKPRAAEIFPKLEDIAYRIGLDEYALMLLERGDDADKVLAFNALGHLREPRALEFAVKFSAGEGPELSRGAAQCALRIQPRFIHGVVMLIGERDDWVRSRVELMLKEVDPELLDSAMQQAVEKSANQSKRQLLDHMRFCRPATARGICKKILSESEDTETIAAALRSLAPLSDETDRGIALRFCHSEEAIVLLSALRVLRKCVRYEDRELLERLTAHRDYWVRLRAAEAVVQLYGESGLAAEFLAGHADRYARDAVKQAIAEEKLWALRRKPKNDRRGTQGQPAEPVTMPPAAPQPARSAPQPSIVRANPEPVLQQPAFAPRSVVQFVTAQRPRIVPDAEPKIGVPEISWAQRIDRTAVHLTASEKIQLIDRLGLIGQAWCESILLQAEYEEGESAVVASIALALADCQHRESA
ncbi:MAG: hypothetical protein ABR584_08090 [Candidatus Baltobacteraceae bacterium]